MTIFNKSILFCILSLQAPFAAASDYRAEDAALPSGAAFSGRSKYQFLYQSYPEDSLFRDWLGPSSTDQYLEARLKFAATQQHWNFNVDYQFIAIHADTLLLASGLPGSALPASSVITDERRWMNLTYSYGDDERTVFVHRLDRASVGFTTERTVWRFGRQAISWGNGMMFTPLDVFNPFDPAAVDKEYKTGDDMLYGQFLFANGDDLQGVAIVRRDPRSGEVQSDQSSLALKYHGFVGMNEFDLLAAEHYGDRLLGVGGNMALGGAVWRGDLTWTQTDRDEVLSAVTSVSYSWVWHDTNITGLVEYYHNGFGQPDSAYAPADLAGNPDLLLRLERAELFTLGRQYLAASATVEVTPLFLLSPNLFVNLEDPSALAQIVARVDVRQELMFLCALSFPVGPSGSEYGGIEVPAANRFLSSGPSLFAQLAWYF
jgi:hypothetical protein